MVVKANRAKGLEGGKVRLVAFRSVVTHILPALMARFRQQFPLIEVEIMDVDEHSKIEALLRSSQADIGIVDLPCSDEFATWEIFRDEYVVLLLPRLKTNSTELTWQQLATYPLIISAKNSCSLAIRECLKQSPEPINIAYQMQEDSSIVGMAMGGLGAAIMPQLAAEPIPEQLAVYSLPVPLERVIRAAILQDALHTPAVYAFLEVLKTYNTSNA